MNVNDQMKLATTYNRAYRTGNELVSDAEYDLLLKNIEQHFAMTVSADTFEDFKKTLMDMPGDVKSNYVLGSLTKIKFEDSEDLYKWIKKENISSLFISEKLDGCSYEANYRYGEYVSCASKGDSIEGTDWTEKGRIILPQTIANKAPIFDIRGEFSLVGDTYKELGYKTRRAGTVGIMNRNELSSDIGHVKAFAYQILSGDDPIHLQFDNLACLGFTTPNYTMRRKEHIDLNIHEDLKKVYLDWKAVADYEIDGIVISEIDWKNENDQFLPKKKVAFKVNSEGIETEVIDIEWELSKGRLLKPVLLLTPIEIDGTTVQRATGYHASYLLENGIDKGAIVSIIKSGCIIPKVINVIKKAEEVNLPDYCPECDSSLKWYGVELQCSNLDCGELKRVEHFVKQSEIENVSKKRLAEWGIYTFENLFKWEPNQNYKSQVDFYSELLYKVFKQPKENIMRNFFHEGFGQTLFDKMITHFRTLEIMNQIMNKEKSPTTLPEGIGLRTIEKASFDWTKNWYILLNILSDPRYSEIKKQTKGETKMSEGKFAGKRVLFTGKFLEVRSKLEQMCIAEGAILANSVTKDLDILFAAEDKWGNSSKFIKASKLGITIKNEEEFWKMIS